MPKSHPPYSAEFRAEAIRLVRSSGKTTTAIAQELGISLEALRAWLRQAELDAGERHDGLSSEDLSELRRLRRENKVLREEREILVQAAAFFVPSSLGRPPHSQEEVRVRRAMNGLLLHYPPVPSPRCLPAWLARRGGGVDLPSALSPLCSCVSRSWRSIPRAGRPMARRASTRSYGRGACGADANAWRASCRWPQ
jgi:transposase